MLKRSQVQRLYRHCEQCAHAKTNFELAQKHKWAVIELITEHLDNPESDYFSHDEAQMLRMFCHRCFTERFAPDAETARDMFLREARSHLK